MIAPTFIPTDYFNVRRFGAKGNGRVISGVSTTNGSNVLTKIGGVAFSSGDVGKLIVIPGSGPSNTVLASEIATITNANEITLADNASVTQSGAFATYGTDDAEAIQLCFDAAPIGSRVYLPKGLYIIGSEIQLNNKVLVIQGESSALGTGIGTTIYRARNNVGLSVTATHEARIAGFQIHNLRIDGSKDWTTDSIRLRFLTSMRLDNVILNNSGGNGIYFEECWDSVIIQLFTRWCGKYSADKAALFFEGPLTDNNNEMRFFGCQFESATYGPLVIAAEPQVGAGAGMANNSIVFDNCKFEPSDRPNGSATPIVLHTIHNAGFNHCRFSQFAMPDDSGYMIECDEGTHGVYITAAAGTNTVNVPTDFARFEDSESCSVEVTGYRVGSIEVGAGCAAIQYNVAQLSEPIEQFPPVGNVDPGIAYIRSNGSDADGDGSPASPYLTAQQAYDDGFRTFDLGVGNFGNILIDDNVTLSIRGMGRNISFLNRVGNGEATTNSLTLILQGISIATSDASPNQNGFGADGVPAGNLTIYSDMASEINVASVQGGAGGDGDGVTAGGSGGQGGVLTLIGAVNVTSNTIAIGGVPGADGGNGTGVNGSDGTISLQNGPIITNPVPNPTVIGAAIVNGVGYLNSYP